MSFGHEPRHWAPPPRSMGINDMRPDLDPFGSKALSMSNWILADMKTPELVSEAEFLSQHLEFRTMKSSQGASPPTEHANRSREVRANPDCARHPEDRSDKQFSMRSGSSYWPVDQSGLPMARQESDSPVLFHRRGWRLTPDNFPAGRMPPIVKEATTGLHHQQTASLFDHPVGAAGTKRSFAHW